jgi:hypothetical protein
VTGVFAGGATPATAAELLGNHARAVTADGKRLTGLGKLPDNAVVVIDGRSMTARDVRAELHALALRTLHAPKTFIGAGTTSRHERSAQIAGQSFGRDNVAGNNVVSNNVVATSAPAQFAGSQGAFARPDPNFCETHAPIIQHVKGSVTPGGYVVIEGLCFGPRGYASLDGSFSDGQLPLTVQSWGDTSITAAIPQVSGVYDQTAALQIIAIRKPSNRVNVQFTATRDIEPLPAHFISNVSCSQGNVQTNLPGDNATSTCDNAGASHWQEDTGTDRWQAQVPQGWVLTSLALSTGLGSIIGTEGFDAAPPAAEQWSVSWQSGVAGTAFQDTIVWGIFISTTTVNLTAASYSMQLYASGPIGTMPQ